MFLYSGHRISTSKSFFVLLSLCPPITDYFVYIYLHRNKLQRSQEIILAISQKVASNGNFYYCKGCYKIDFCLVSVPTFNSGSSLSGTIIFFTSLSSNLLLTSSLLSHRIHKTLGENILKNLMVSAVLL